MRWLRGKAGLSSAVACFALVASALCRQPAHALSIELKDAAPHRIEQQRQEALGRLPLVGTPDLSRRAERLASAGLKVGDPVFIRVFKAEAELEVWMMKGDAFVLFATYPVCFWSGLLGPKLVEGDNQTPEGFYTVTRRQLHRSGRHPRSLNLGFPNQFDKKNARTGSYILVHGACSSVGCFAMTDPVAEEIFGLAERALYSGQERIHVHSFPFRMTGANLAQHSASQWFEFWETLKPAYDAFEATRLPPSIGVCEGKYTTVEGRNGDKGDPGALSVIRSGSDGTRGRPACNPPEAQTVAARPAAAQPVSLPINTIETGSIPNGAKSVSKPNLGASTASSTEVSASTASEPATRTSGARRLRYLKKSGSAVARLKARRVTVQRSAARRDRRNHITVTARKNAVRQRSARRAASQGNVAVSAGRSTKEALFSSN